MNNPDGVSMFVTAQDGLKLHVRGYGPRTATALPVVCLAGLTRTAADFHALAVALASDGERPRRVLALDSRGRGQSDYDANPDNYAVPVELNDAITVMTACETAPAVLIGTSRGGLLTMALAAARPAMIAGVVLNDIGPEIDIQGLMRIKGTVGRLPELRSYAEGAEILRRAYAAHFPRLTAQDWEAWARRGWKSQRSALEGERLVPNYDAKLARTLADIDPERPIPPLWPQFDALAAVPMMVVRGANSDLLSAATVAAMRARRSEMTVLEIPDQGHTPLLSEPDTIARIAAFVAQCDAKRKAHV